MFEQKQPEISGLYMYKFDRFEVGVFELRGGEREVIYCDSIE